METTASPTTRSETTPLLKSLALSAALALLGAAYALVCNYEIEPNDDPATATPLATTAWRSSSDASPICVSGSFGDGGPDLYRWEVGVYEALQRWVIDLESLRGQATTLSLQRVTFAPDGAGVAAADRLLEFGTPDGRPVTSEEFQLEPGTYYLGTNVSGGAGEYVATLRPVDRVDRGSSRLEAGRRYSDEFNAFGAVAADTAFEWVVDSRYAGYLWGIEARSALGAPVSLRLVGAAGEIVRLSASPAARRDGLGIEPGTYTVELSGASGTAWLRFERQGQRSDGAEIEPNDNAETANALIPGAEIRGTLDGNDYYRVDLGSKDGVSSWELVVMGVGAQPFDAYLEDSGRRTLMTRRDVTGFSQVVTLPPGAYLLRLAGREGDYTVAWRQATTPAAGIELEPNDAPRLATPLDESGQVRGVLEGHGRDLFALEVEGEAQFYRLQAIGGGVSRLRVLDTSEGVFAQVSGEARLRLDDLVLLPGRHLIEVSGTSGEYALRAIPLGPAPTAADVASQSEGAPGVGEPLSAASAGAAGAQDRQTFDTDPGPPPPPGVRELEPNDDATRAQRLFPGSVHVGRLTSTGDQDYYRFHLLADQYVRIELMPPVGEISIPLSLDRIGWVETPVAELGSPVVLERWFLAGDHGVMVGMRGGAEAPTGYYQLRMTLLDSALTPADAEPNDDRRQAGLLPGELTWTGRVGETRDDDVYRLPVFEAETQVRFAQAPGTEVELALLSEGSTLTSARSGAELEVSLAPGETHYLRVRGSGYYELSAEFSQRPDAAQLLAPRTTDALSLSLVAPTDEVAAFWHQGQVLSTTVTVENLSDQQQQVEFAVAVSDARAEVPALPAVTLAPGESRTVDVEVALPPELRDDQGVRVDVAALSTAGSASAGFSAVPLCEAAPVLPFEHHGVRQALAGRMNALWQGLGSAAFGDSDRPNRDAALIDGRISPAYAGTLDAGHSPTFALAGGEPLTLIGALLNPMSGVTAESQLKGFRIETSTDGVSFQPALEGELASAAVEQAFEFAAPVSARYARLVFVSSQGGGNSAYLGEFKLIAEDPAVLGPHNLADPRLGGHVAWSRPLLDGYGQTVLSAEDDVNGAVDLRDTGELAFVIGFQDGRAAQIERLAWRDGPRSVGNQNPTAARVLVEVSLAGPAGPWRELADWRLERGSGTEAELALEAPVWARFLRFTAPAVEGERYLWPPDQVSVIERRATDGYMSALGEWGTASSSGVYEAQLGLGSRVGALQTASDPGETPQTALRLTSGAAFTDSVAIGEDVDWLVFSVPQGENHFDLALAGDPAIGYSYRLLGSDLTPVAFEIGEEADGVRLSGFAEPGDYYLHIEEPKRTVVFAWDNSGSMGPYLSIVYNSLATFALGVDREREAVQLLPYSDPRPRWLLPIWSSDPARVQYALATYDRADGSSDSEGAMLEASRALGQRSGTRAILLITDAESDGYRLTSELWESLQETRPRVFTFEVSSGGNARPQDLMQDWAQVNGGSYLMAANVGEVDAGFTRAACILRRPKGYTVEVLTRYQQPPGPGTLTVLRGADGPAPAIEVIFDASGSMGRPLPSGEQRIVAARRAIEKLVGEVLPDGTEFALRAFGHITPSSCESRLDVRLAPLDRAAAAAAVGAIEPKLLSQTPLADALAAVADDLAGARSSRMVILVTDGEESCGGDPVAAAQALKASGPVEIAIVSLGLEPAAQAVFESLAAGVGASYVDVTSFEELEASISEALNPAYEVLDAAGQVVARGRVGDDGVELPMGLYTVRVLSAPVTEFTEVRVPGDGSVELSVGAR